MPHSARRRRNSVDEFLQSISPTERCRNDLFFARRVVWYATRLAGASSCSRSDRRQPRIPRIPYRSIYTTKKERKKELRNTREISSATGVEFTKFQSRRPEVLESLASRSRIFGFPSKNKKKRKLITRNGDRRVDSSVACLDFLFHRTDHARHTHALLILMIQKLSQQFSFSPKPPSIGRFTTRL